MTMMGRSTEGNEKKIRGNLIFKKKKKKSLQEKAKKIKVFFF